MPLCHLSTLLSAGVSIIPFSPLVVGPYGLLLKGALLAALFLLIIIPHPSSMHSYQSSVHSQGCASLEKFHGPSQAPSSL